MVVCDCYGAFEEIAGSGVVAEACPFVHDVLRIGCGQRFYIRPFVQEFQEIRDDGGDCCLLEHDFGEPDVVWVRGLSG